MTGDPGVAPQPTPAEQRVVSESLRRIGAGAEGWAGTVLADLKAAGFTVARLEQVGQIGHDLTERICWLDGELASVRGELDTARQLWDETSIERRRWQNERDAARPVLDAAEAWYDVVVDAKDAGRAPLVLSDAFIQSSATLHGAIAARRRGGPVPPQPAAERCDDCGTTVDVVHQGRARRCNTCIDAGDAPSSLPAAQSPIPDARAMASGLVYAPDPYKEAKRLKAERAAAGPVPPPSPPPAEQWEGFDGFGTGIRRAVGAASPPPQQETNDD